MIEVFGNPRTEMVIFNVKTPNIDLSDDEISVAAIPSEARTLAESITKAANIAEGKTE